MKLLDLFSGIGGFSLGFINAGYKITDHYYSEINKYANYVYKRRFINAKGLGDIKFIRSKELPKFDIITFGFPCQDLSIASQSRKGLSASRSGLFFEAIKIIKDVKPRYFIFENVKGLFSSNEGKDFDIVLRTVTDIGYDGQWQLLNTRWFLPQNRERIYFIGHIRGECRPKVFPIGEDGFEFNKTQEKTQGKRKWFWSKDTQIANTLSSRYYKDGSENLIQIGIIGKDSEATRVYDPSGISRTIKNGGGMGAKTGLYKINSNIRRLTPKECERLQGFPDGWTKGQSDTQRYKQLGNAVSVPVVEEIANRLKDYIIK